MTQRELAKAVGVKEIVVQDWENSRKMPNIDQMNRLLSVLELKESDLFLVDEDLLEEEREFNGDRLKEIRLERGLSQKKLSKMIGCHYMSMSRWETGAVIPNQRNIEKLSDILQCKTADFFD